MMLNGNVTFSSHTQSLKVGVIYYIIGPPAIMVNISNLYIYIYIYIGHSYGGTMVSNAQNHSNFSKFSNCEYIPSYKNSIHTYTYQQNNSNLTLFHNP
jgi:hypothetical protein